jgi:hypothetical protein
MFRIGSLLIVTTVYFPFAVAGWLYAGSSLTASARASREQQQERATLLGHTDIIYTVAISPDGKTLASSSRDKTIRIWDLATGMQRAILRDQEDKATCLAFSPDGKNLAYPHSDKNPLQHKLLVCEIASGKTVASFAGHRKPVSSIAFSPNGKMLASGASDESVKVWDVSTGQNIKTFDGPPSGNSPEFRVTFSPDGAMIASLGNASKLRIWESSTGEPRGALDTHISATRALVFSPNSRFLAAGGAGVIQVWDVYARRKWAILRECTGASVAFSSNGLCLLSESNDFAIKLFHLSTGSTMATLKGHNAPIVSAVFSPDDKTLISASADKTIKVWNLPNAAYEKEVDQLLRDLHSDNRENSEGAAHRLLQIGTPILDRLEQTGMATDLKAKTKLDELISQISGGKSRLPPNVESKPVVVKDMEFQLITDRDWTIPDGRAGVDVDITLRLTNRSERAQRVFLAIAGLSLKDAAGKEHVSGGAIKSAVIAPRFSEPFGIDQSEEIGLRCALTRSNAGLDLKWSDAFLRTWFSKGLSTGNYTLSVSYVNNQAKTADGNALWIATAQVSIENITIK